MSTPFQIALSMENAIQEELQTQLNNSQVPELRPLIELLIKGQISILQLLSQANNEIFPYNSNEISGKILGNDNVWKEAGTIKNNASSPSSCLVQLWILSGLLDKSSQYYRQAALNSAYQQNKLFFSSIAEVKVIQNRRIDSVLRSIYNIIWGDIGFAPFSLGRS